MSCAMPSRNPLFWLMRQRAELPLRSASALSMIAIASDMPQVSVTCASVVLLGSTPWLRRRQVGVGRLVRTESRWPVGRLPSIHSMSSRISLRWLSSSATSAIEPSGARFLAKSASV